MHIYILYRNYKVCEFCYIRASLCPRVWPIWFLTIGKPDRVSGLPEHQGHVYVCPKITILLSVTQPRLKEQVEVDGSSFSGFIQLRWSVWPRLGWAVCSHYSQTDSFVPIHASRSPWSSSGNLDGKAVPDRCLLWNWKAASSRVHCHPRPVYKSDIHRKRTGFPLMRSAFHLYASVR